MDAKRTCETCVFCQDLEDNLTGVCRKNAPSPILHKTGTGVSPEMDTNWPIVYITAVCGEHRTEAEFEAERASLAIFNAGCKSCDGEIRDIAGDLDQQVAKLAEDRRKLAEALISAWAIHMKWDALAEVLRSAPIWMSPATAAAFMATMEATEGCEGHAARLLAYLDTGELPK